MCCLGVSHAGLGMLTNATLPASACGRTPTTLVPWRVRVAIVTGGLGAAAPGRANNTAAVVITVLSRRRRYSVGGLGGAVLVAASPGPTVSPIVKQL
jgi:hypothetical protein